MTTVDNEDRLIVCLAKIWRMFPKQTCFQNLASELRDSNRDLTCKERNAVKVCYFESICHEVDMSALINLIFIQLIHSANRANRKFYNNFVCLQNVLSRLWQFIYKIFPNFSLFSWEIFCRDPFCFFKLCQKLTEQ